MMSGYPFFEFIVFIQSCDLYGQRIMADIPFMKAMLTKLSEFYSDMAACT